MKKEHGQALVACRVPSLHSFCTIDYRSSYASTNLSADVMKTRIEVPFSVKGSPSGTRG